MHHRSTRRRNSLVAPRTLPALAAVGVVAAVVIAGGIGGGGSGNGRATQTVATAPTTTATDAAAPTTVASTAGVVAVTAAGLAAPPTSTTVVPTTTRAPEPEVHHLRQPIGLGMTGPDVRAVQTRLEELGFFVGPVDGQFGNLTKQAVWAYEKLVLGVPHDEPTGIVTDEMWGRMQEPSEIEPRRSSRAGDATTQHTEIYLPEQVVVFFVDDEPALISHMSSGSGEEWREIVTIDVGEYGNENGTTPLQRGEIGVSFTPGGVFRYSRFIEGTRESALGSMWNPGYFNFGIAIHGARNVPLKPASHGCIRVPLAVGETFHQYAEPGDLVFVWDGIEEPEFYGDQLPIFNRLDPDWAATTTTLAPG